MNKLRKSKIFFIGVVACVVALLFATSIAFALSNTSVGQDNQSKNVAQSDTAADPSQLSVSPVANEPLFYAVFNTNSEGSMPENTLSFYYDENVESHKGVEGKTVYESLPTEVTEAASWPYDSIRDNIIYVSINNSVKNYQGLTSTAYMFCDLNYIEDFSGFENLTVNNVTDMSYMFCNFGGESVLSSVPDTKNWDTSNVKKMTAMFKFYAYFSEDIALVPDTTNWNTSNVESMDFMFHEYACSGTGINVVPNTANWNTSKVTTMENMFYGYGYGSETIEIVPDVSLWDVGNVSNMNNLFSDYGRSSGNLNAVPDVSEWNVAKVTKMNYLFCSYGYTSSKLNVVPDVSEWNVEKVANMSGMFYEYGHSSVNINAVPDVSAWKTSSVTDLSYMFFEYAKSSQAISVVPKVDSWDTSKVTTMSYMFNQYALNSKVSLDSLNIANWSITALDYCSYMFCDYAGKSTNTVKVYGSDWNEIKPTIKNADNMFVRSMLKGLTYEDWYSANTSTDGCFTSDKPQFYAVLNENTEGEVQPNTLTFYYDKNIEAHEEYERNIVFSDLPTEAAYFDEWGYTDKTYANKIKHVNIDPSLANFTNLKSTLGMFTNLINAEDIVGCEYLDVSNVTNMNNTFNGFGIAVEQFSCVPNVAGWSTSNVTSMKGMFANYGSSSTVLNSVPDVSEWDVSSVTDLRQIFYRYAYSCESFTKVPAVGEWETSAVEYMDSAFKEYGFSSTDKLETLDLSNWSIDSLISCPSMFESYGYSTSSLCTVLGTNWCDSKSDVVADDMFMDCSLKGDTSGDWSSAKTYDDGCFTNNNPTFYAVYNTAAEGEKIPNTLTLYYDNDSETHMQSLSKTVFNDLPVGEEQVFSWPYMAVAPMVKAVVIDSSLNKLHNILDTSRMFYGGIYEGEEYGFANADSISGCENLIMDDVANASSMFNGFGYNSKTLSTVPDVSNWNTENIGYACYMFANYGRSSTNITMPPDVSNWEISGCYDLRGIFSGYGYSSKGIVDAPNVSLWQTSSVDFIDNAFEDYAYSSLKLATAPDLNNWDLTWVESMSYMFTRYGYSSLVLNQAPKVASLDTSNVTNFENMFMSYGFKSKVLTDVPDVSKWDTTKVTNMSYMFKNYAYTCKTTLNALDLTDWKIDALKDCSGMFQCYAYSNPVAQRPVVYATDWCGDQPQSFLKAVKMFNKSKLKGSIDYDWWAAHTGDYGCFTQKGSLETNNANTILQANKNIANVEKIESSEVDKTDVGKAYGDNADADLSNVGDNNYNNYESAIQPSVQVNNVSSRAIRDSNKVFDFIEKYILSAFMVQQ